MADLSYFIEKRNRLLIDFNTIKEKDKEEKMKKLKNILDENNTEEVFIIEYLNLKLILQQQNKDKEKSFLNELEKYEIGVNKIIFNKNFGNYFLKQSAYEKIIDLFEKIKNISYEKTKEGKLNKMIEILEMKNDKYEQSFPISYLINKELYFNSLIYYLNKQIQKTYTDEKSKDIDENKIENKKKEYENKIKEINSLKTLTEEEKNKKINELNKIIKNIYICFCNNFTSYILSLSKFIDKIFLAFQEKFSKNSNIFTTDKYENEQKSDIYLFTDFIFFLIRFNFKDSHISFYIKIWKETFSPVFNPKDDYAIRDLMLKYIDNDLLIIYKNEDGSDDEIKIKNIDFYIHKLIDDIKENTIDKINCFEKMKYLKIDKFYSSIFIKSKWEIISNYIIEILLSQTLQDIYSRLYYSKEHVALNESDMKKIMDNLHFFNFRTNFVAETKKRFLFIYIQASISSENDYNTDIKKIIYLVIFLISCMHEILGHLYLRINNYIYKTEKISSPKPKFPSEYAEERDKESGEFIEEQLFGNYNFKMTMKEILFALDKENYKNGLMEFQNNYKKANEKDINNISNELNNILNAFGISLNKLNINSKNKYSVNKSKNQEKYIFPQHHSIEQIDSDDD